MFCGIEHIADSFHVHNTALPHLLTNERQQGEQHSVVNTIENHNAHNTTHHTNNTQPTRKCKTTVKPQNVISHQFHTKLFRTHTHMHVCCRVHVNIIHMHCCWPNNHQWHTFDSATSTIVQTTTAHTNNTDMHTKTNTHMHVHDNRVAVVDHRSTTMYTSDCSSYQANTNTHDSTTFPVALFRFTSQHATQ